MCMLWARGLSIYVIYDPALKTAFGGTAAKTVLVFS